MVHVQLPGEHHLWDTGDQVQDQGHVHVRGSATMSCGGNQTLTRFGRYTCTCSSLGRAIFGGTRRCEVYHVLGVETRLGLGRVVNAQLLGMGQL